MIIWVVCSRKNGKPAFYWPQNRTIWVPDTYGLYPLLQCY